MIVIDASVMAEYLVGSALGLKAASLLADHTSDLHIPHLCTAETMSVLRAWVQRSEVEPSRAAAAVIDLGDLDAVRYPHEPLLPRVWELRDNVTAYDALYVALAEELDAPLLTLDGRMARSPGHRASIELLAL